MTSGWNGVSPYSPKFGLAGISATLAVLAMANMLFGLVQNWYITTTLGVGRATDAFVAGLAIPQVVVAVFVTPLAQVVLPLLAAQGDASQRRDDAWNLLISVSIVHAVFAIVLSATVPMWARFTVPGFAPSAVALTEQMARIHLVGMVFTGAYTVQRAYLNAAHRFLWAEGSLLIANVIGVTFLYFALPHYGPTMAAWALTIELGLPVLFLLPALRPFRWPQFRSVAARETWDRLRPLLMGTTFYKTEVLLDRALASLLPPGSLSLYQLSLQLYANGNNLVNKALVTPVTPGLAHHAARGEWIRFHAMLRRRMKVVLAFGFFVTVLLVLVGKPTLTFVFARGRLTPPQVAILYTLMLVMVGYWFGSIGGLLSSSAFYARGDTRFPTRVGTISYAISIPLKIYAAVRFGVYGLAFAATAYYLANFLIQLSALHHQRGRDLPEDLETRRAE